MSLLYYVTCPSCRNELIIPDKYMEVKGTCKHCNFRFVPMDSKQHDLKEAPWYYWLLTIFFPLIGLIFGLFLDKYEYKKYKYIGASLTWFLISTMIFIAANTETSSNNTVYIREPTYALPDQKVEYTTFDINKITLNDFNQIQTGMTYNQVKEILRRDGVCDSQSNFMGITSSIYSWDNEYFGDGNITVMFQNNRVISKSQFMLK